MLKRSYLCGGSMAALALAVAAPSAAQETRPAAEVSEVVVTGSFIRGTPEDAALPVQVLNSDTLEKQGAPSMVDLIKQLSVSSGVLGETNQFDTRAQGSEGSGSINLRGLGAPRTLVLMNGRRMAYNPFGQAAAGIVDTNTLPVGAVGRIEVLKEGAAATYGSDAIGGVVNFITRKNLDGFEVAGSYRYIDGSDGDADATVNWGHVWDNGNVLLSFGYQHRSELQTGKRDWALQPFNNNPEGGWSGGNAVTAFIPIARTATGAFTPVAAAFQLDQGCAPLGGVPVGGALPACNFQYTAWDNIVEEENRYQVYGEANADLSEHHHLHVEALYAKTDVPHWKTSPSYLALQTPTVTTNPEVGTLTPAVLAGYYVPSDNPGFAAYQQAHPGQIPLTATAVHIPGVRYRPLSFGGNPIFDNGRGSSEGLRQYEAFRVSGGLTGDLPWYGIGYDVAVTFGQETGRRTGYDTVVSRLQLALRGYGSLASGAQGGCTAAETNGFTTGAGNAALGCYYFNPFSTSTAANAISGQANPGFVASTANNPDLIRWFFPQVSTKQVSRLFVTDAVLNGKTGISLPGGEIAWAAGMQYRRESFESRYDDLSNIKVNPCIDTPVTGSTTCTIRNGPLAFLGTGEEQELHNDVWAGFGELSLPVTDKIEAQLAIRHEEYGMEVGSTTNPKLSAKWQITDWFALRATVGTTFRGPPLTSLTNSSVTGLSFIAGSFRAIDFFGNPALRPEKAKQYSVGGLFKFGGLKAAIDYWRFDFENPIVAEPSGAIVSTMFPNNTNVNCGNPAFAGLQARFTFQGACSLATIARLRTLAVNGPGIQTSGIDFLADYSVGKLFDGDLTVGGNATYTLEYQIDPFEVEGVTVQPGFDAVGFLNYQLSATSLPQLKGQAYVEWTRGPHNLRITESYIDSYIDQRTSILAPNPVTGQVLSEGTKIDATWLTNVTYRGRLPWDTTVTVSIDNLFDQDPSFARLDLNYDPFTGNPLGRTYKVSLRKRF
jgi:iron complex outermembrane receptor protein